MKEFFSVKRNIVLVAVVAVVALLLIGSFLAEFGLGCASCNVAASACNPLSCVVDGCMGCTDCVGCVLGCD